MAARMSTDDLANLMGKGKKPRTIPADEGIGPGEGEGGEKITDEEEWKIRVSEIISEAKGKIEEITPPEFADRIDDEIRATLGEGAPERAMPEAMPEEMRMGGL